MSIQMTSTLTMQRQNVSALDDFRRSFRDFDDSVLITPTQWAALCGQTRGSVYTARARGHLPTPVVDSNRCLRWTAGQYREWAKNLAGASPLSRPAGRPRKAADTPGMQK